MKDHLPDHLKFGYDAVVEQSAIREQLRLEHPDWDSNRIYFAMQARYEAAHANDVTFAERCKQRNLRAEADQENAWRDGVGLRNGFTKPELEYMIERLDGVNDPVGQAVLAKLLLLQ